jgi:hypothetical protein
VHPKRCDGHKMAVHDHFCWLACARMRSPPGCPEFKPFARSVFGIRLPRSPRPSRCQLVKVRPHTWLEPGSSPLSIDPLQLPPDAPWGFRPFPSPRSLLPRPLPVKGSGSRVMSGPAFEVVARQV